MEAEGGGRAAAGCLYLVDTLAGDPEVLRVDAETYHEKLLKKSSSTPDVLSIPGGEEVKLEDSCVCFVPLFRNNSTCKMLLLTDPKDKETVLAVYLNQRWWPVEDVVKTADPSRDGLISVQTFGERIVLFVLNYIIFGMLEGSSANDAFFLPHSATECAKILWRNGEAVAFYSVKMKVCQKFLQTYPEEQKRLWEVEAPGDWSQRVNIWLKIQMESSPSGKAEVGSCMETTQTTKPRQSDVDQMYKGVEYIPGVGKVAGDATEKKDDTAAAWTLNSQGPEQEDLEQGAGNTQQCKGFRRKAGLVGGKATKQFRVIP
ncbi:protein FAM169B-like isoform X2 [Strix aluco]|uniref:protein FAM169B-like isoform X2 n=1 Tax=Strix aluco TaxID=111821 RepID=UPI003DA313C5